MIRLTRSISNANKLIVATFLIFSSTPADQVRRSKSLWHPHDISPLVWSVQITEDTIPSFTDLPPPHGPSTEPEGTLFTGRDTDKLWLQPLLGYQYRLFRGEKVHVNDMGLRVTGDAAPFRFLVDARIYSEFTNKNLPSYDGSFIERQQDTSLSDVQYNSYARFRGNVTYENHGWIFGASHDAPHWGPAVHMPLSLGSQTPPFWHLTLLKSIGPFQVSGLWGKLSIDGEGAFRSTMNTRSLYAHRYQWAPSPWFTLGISETLILYNHEEPFAFIPIFPLFMIKGETLETKNNGNLAFDLQLRWPGRARFWTEFLLDDVHSPSGLFNDYWGNKWAWTVGWQWIHALRPGWNLGLLAEYSRLEPWVYTHYQPGTSQSTHRGRPLGHPVGPDAQTSIAQILLKSKNHEHSLSIAAMDKGAQKGSAVGDTMVAWNVNWQEHLAPKRFLRNAPKTYRELIYEGLWNWRSLTFFGRLGIPLSGTRSDAWLLWQSATHAGVLLGF